MALPFLIYLVATSRPLNRRLQFLPWNRLAVLAIDILMFILWIAASALSTYTCEGLCEACTPFGNKNYDADNGPYFNVWVGSLSCECVIPSLVDDTVESDSGDSFVKRLVRRAGGGRPSSYSGRISGGIGKADKLTERVGLDWTML